MDSAWIPRDSSGKVETVQSVRKDLAAVYNLLHQFKLNEGACNHLTALVPGTNDCFFVIRYGLLWSEVTADNLVMVDSSGKILEGEGPVEVTAFEIHRAIHMADATKYKAVLHTHSPYVTALCCIAGSKGLQMCHQNSLRFYDDWVFEDRFEGLVMDDTLGARIADAMQGKRVLLHAHHGVIVTGTSVAEAFDDLYYLERACMHQTLAMSTGQPLALVDKQVCLSTKREFDLEKSATARLHLDALQRELEHGQRATRSQRICTICTVLTAVAALSAISLVARK